MILFDPCVESYKIICMKKIIAYPLAALFALLAFCLCFECGGDGKPAIPELRPISTGQAELLAAYARRLRVETADGVTRPVSWAMVNVSCQDRSMALQYAIASAPEVIGTDPPMMRAAELTAEHISILAASPRYDAATLIAAGPLATRQTYVVPYGGPVTGPAAFYYWPNHQAVVINVEGTLKVLDLSTGDTPIEIDEWLHNFIDPSVECFHLDAEDFHKVWVYWNTVFNNFPPEPGARPEHLCAYTLAGIFTSRADQAPADLAEFIRNVPSEMQVQLDVLYYDLRRVHGITLPEADLPFVTSTYAPGTEADICTLVNLTYCETL